MQATFFQKVLGTLVAAFFAACLVWGYKHIVQRAFYESNEGWKSSLYDSPTPGRGR